MVWFQEILISTTADLRILGDNWQLHACKNECSEYLLNLWCRFGSASSWEIFQPFARAPGTLQIFICTTIICLDFPLGDAVEDHVHVSPPGESV